MKSVLLLVFTLFLCKAYCQNGCGDSSWIPYKDQKCYKLLSPDTTVKRAIAEELCSRERTPKQDISETYLPTLAEILDAEEQKLIENYIFGNFTVYNNVWIRAKRGSENTFYWSEGRPMQFAHWEPTSPTTEPVRGCVVLTSGLTRMDDLNQENINKNKYDILAGAGLWRDINCQSYASVVCQKLSTDITQQTTPTDITPDDVTETLSTTKPTKPSGTATTPAVTETTTAGAGLGQNGCGDSSWIPYKDQKCYKLLSPETTESRATAEDLCSRERTPKQDISETYLPTLAEILNAEEQKLIENYIFGNFTAYNNVWIRAQRGSDNVFYWSQGRPIQFEHWEPNFPTTQPDRSCVVLTSGLTRMDDPNQENINENKYDIAVGAGLWRDVICQASALVVCQKYQTWSVPQMQAILMEIRTNLEFEINNKIPVGFIYVQIPSQKSPQELWPKFKWIDISERPLPGDITLSTDDPASASIIWRREA